MAAPALKEAPIYNVHSEGPVTEVAVTAVRMIKDYYAALGTRAIVYLDKDRTVVDPQTGLPTAPGYEETVERAQKQGVILAWDSDSSLHDLHVTGKQFGMKGLHVAELGGVVGLPDGKEIHLVESADWFTRLLNRTTGRIYLDEILRSDTALYNGDPWDIIYNNTHFPGSQNRLVMVNRGRRVSASILTALLDQERGGKIIRGTPESLSFFAEMASLMQKERDALLGEERFPDAGGIRDDINHLLEVATMTSNLATKRRGMQYMAEVLGLPIYHIGDSHHDDTTGIPGVTTLAVGNGTCRDHPGVIFTEKNMTGGTIELINDVILPKFSG